jgi:hypothetical protein
LVKDLSMRELEPEYSSAEHSACRRVMRNVVCACALGIWLSPVVICSSADSGCCPLQANLHICCTHRWFGLLVALGLPPPQPRDSFPRPVILHSCAVLHVALLVVIGELTTLCLSLSQSGGIAGELAVLSLSRIEHQVSDLSFFFLAGADLHVSADMKVCQATLTAGPFEMF